MVIDDILTLSISSVLSLEVIGNENIWVSHSFILLSQEDYICRGLKRVDILRQDFGQ